MKTHNDIAIGYNVKLYRRSANITQQALADHLGISYQQIQKYESGANRIAAGRIPHISALLGCTYDDLFEGTEARA